MKVDAELITDIVERFEYQPMYIQQFLFGLWLREEITPETIPQIYTQILERREDEFIIL